MVDGREDEEYDPGDKEREECPAYDARGALPNETKSTLDAVERATFHEKKLAVLRCAESFYHCEFLYTPMSA
jgi:hypothetical protein